MGGGTGAVALWKGLWVLWGTASAWRVLLAWAWRAPGQQLLPGCVCPRIYLLLGPRQPAAGAGRLYHSAPLLMPCQARSEHFASQNTHMLL
jgi:hypothetical protein